MIIYNYKKEFLGIDEKDLQALGFKSLQGLQREVNDFSDLFVKTPGYIHNFKHVHWIDFITCAESNEESKVIINVNNKNFKATVQISTTYLVDNPAAKAFIVHLTHLRELSIKESESISGDIVEREAPVAIAQPATIVTAGSSAASTQASSEDVPVVKAPVSVDAFDTPDENVNVTLDPYETPLEVDFDEPEEELQEETQKVKEEFLEEEAPLDITLDDDISLDISLEEDEPDTTLNAPSNTTNTVEEDFDNGYTYDPSVASDELGLPLDLIEEFIQDFIEQAKDFKDDLYTALDNADMDNLKILSHKLKGVAANLRIEDALEALTSANTSSDINIVRGNLDTFYKIVAKLSGEEISVQEKIQDEVEDDLPLDIKIPEEEEKEEVLSIEEPEEDLYSDPLEINDIDVPEKIEVAELADDTFEEEQNITLAEDVKIDLEDDALLLVEEESIELPEDDALSLAEDISIELPQDDALSLAEDISIELPEDDIQVAEESALPTYDKEQIANDIGLDAESFQELFEDYIIETELLTKTIESAIENEDFSTCKSETLKLKGMSDNMRVSSFEKELQILSDSSDKQELTDALTSVKLALQAL